MSERGRRRSLAIVLGAAVVWRLAFLFSIDETPLARLHEWPQSDMATFVEQARRIADGDWLARSPYYPYHSWMAPISREEWATWRPAGMFYQPPLYSYALAGLMAIGADVAVGARWVQLLLGVWASGLMFGIGARVFGARTGLLAGQIVALYGPLLMAESQLLRDGPIVFSMLLILWVAVECLEGARKGGLTAGEWRWRAWLLGMLVGVQMMLHESAVFLGAAVLAMGLANQYRVRISIQKRQNGIGGIEDKGKPDRIRLRARAQIEWGVLVIAGMVVGYGPMLARNITVGAPLGPRYFGSAQAFAAANHPDNSDRLMTVPDEPERFIAQMREAQARPMKLAAGTLQAYGDDWPRLLRRAGTRVLALMMGDEIAENVAYAYFKRRVPILSLALDFWWLLPLSVAGAAALGRRRWRAKLRGGLGLILLLGIMTVGLVSLVYPFGRYRLMFLPLLALLAGYGTSRLWLAWRGRNLRQLGVLAGIAGAVALAQIGQRYVAPFREFRVPRAAEYLISSRGWTRMGKLEAAILELEDGLQAIPDSILLQAELALTRGLALQAAGNYAAAVDQYREALRLAPENSLAKLGLATATQGRPISTEPER